MIGKVRYLLQEKHEVFTILAVTNGMNSERSSRFPRPLQPSNQRPALARHLRPSLPAPVLGVQRANVLSTTRLGAILRRVAA